DRMVQVFSASFQIGMQALSAEAAAHIVQGGASLERFSVTVDQDHSPCSGAVQTASRSADDLHGTDIIKTQLVQESVSPGIRIGDIVVIHFNVSYPKRGPQTAAPDIH